MRQKCGVVNTPEEYSASWRDLAVRNQLGREGFASHIRHWAGHKSAMSLCGKEGKEEYCQEVTGGDPFPLLNTGKTHVECWVQGWSSKCRINKGTLERRGTEYRNFTLNIREFILHLGWLKHCNRLPRNIMGFLPLQILKTWLDTVLINLL